MIEKVQEYLQKLYGYKPQDSIARFVLDRDTLSEILEQDSRVNPGDRVELRLNGCLFVIQDGEIGYDVVPKHNGLGLGLFFSEGILEQSPDLLDFGLKNSNLVSFLTMVEEVSHCYYTMHRYNNGRQCSIFEQELQTEIDKFIIAILHQRTLTGCVPINLINYFREKETFSCNPIPEVRVREEDALYFAGIYNSYLFKQLERLNVGLFKREVKRFFRSSIPGKIEMINATW